MGEDGNKQGSLNEQHRLIGKPGGSGARSREINLFIDVKEWSGLLDQT